MNLRNAGEYNIGLDIGTGSVGWSVTDEDGNLLHFKGKPTWGSRIFPSAEPASEARMHRGQRRRYARRRWRLDLLESLFQLEVSAVDPDFFTRLRQTHLLKEDRDPQFADFAGMIFPQAELSERDYYKKFPTVYHLRQWLMKTDERADIRLVYLALHNIVKHRGNFLQQENEGLTSQNSSVKNSVDRFCYELQCYCDALDVPCDAQNAVDDVVAILGDTASSKSGLQEKVSGKLGIEEGGLLDKPAAKRLSKALASALVGLKADMAHIFFVGEEAPEGVATGIYLSNDEQVETFEMVLPDEGRALFEAMQAVYSSYVLQEILSSKPGEGISANKVEDCNRYGEDLRLLKSLVKQYAPEKYDGFFRGAFCAPTSLHPQKHVYDKYGKDQIKGYTRYNEIRKTKYEDFKKEVEALFKGTAAVDDPRYLAMMERFGSERFLRRLKTSDNGAIPFQLHLEEMRAIIDNQAKFYPFLKQERAKLESLVSFRIPYYVGPLTKKNARKAADGKLRFAWVERQEGKEDERIYPWNWEEIVDKDRSATAFIQRMTSTCTYLHGEPVLPKCSLIYEEYCVLNELNGAKLTQDGDREHRLDYKDRTEAVEQLFRRGRVTYKKMEEWLRKRGVSNPHVFGGQGEAGFESKMSSYIFFAKDIFNVDEIPVSDYPMIEEIILWSTLFEDRSIFREKLKRNYGDRLTDEQIKKIVRKRFAGWGKLSKKLLCEVKAETDCGPRSIMDVLREGNPNSDKPSRAMVLMEILHDDDLGFEKLIDTRNREHMSDVGMSLEELPGSPALRRSVNQALSIVDEIAGIAGHAPTNIFIEVTRDEDPRKKGSRTKRRYDDLKEKLAALKQEAPEWWSSNVSRELADCAKANADLSEKLTLYFMQGGKSLYSGKPLEIERLSEYQVDHIIPQTYIKDDSFENKALVLSSENQSKSDQLLLSEDVRRKMRSYWGALHDAKLIGDKKYRNLLRDSILEQQMKGFIARQLVETSQILKVVQNLLREAYPDTRVMPVKAALSSELRHEIGLVKCREANDFHHAHDALLASEMGRFILKRHAAMYENPIGYTHVVRNFVRAESSQAKRGKMPGSASFVVASFMRSGFDEETGELFQDDWSAEREIGRLKRYFNYRQCFISRMPEETSGAFWDATVYSPRDTGKNMTLPLKKGLDAEKYGSYSREQFAYFFIYKAEKKGKEVLEFAPVPVSVASAVGQKPEALVEHARGLAKGKGLVFVEVVRPKVYKYQLMEIDGSRLHLTGGQEARNAVQFAFSLKEAALLKDVFDAGVVSSKELDELFESTLKSLRCYSPKILSALGVSEWEKTFLELLPEEKKAVIKVLVAIGNGKANVADLRAVGKSKFAGQMHPSYGSILTKGGGITFIDQSVTGMFERRTHIGL
ncbi:type II CRISPR RNA-guided endonuclease Cas9 [Adlercreutzia sp. R25]|nr:type II CRISPR RNA-guided endonuclease Cas9 [Adlercreutzia sp. R25]MEC4273656.1 type II CRISPR RNA-guided endonuclease Cas9 [Adlercreutzia sp. R25]